MAITGKRSTKKLPEKESTANFVMPKFVGEASELNSKKTSAAGYRVPMRNSKLNLDAYQNLRNARAPFMESKFGMGTAFDARESIELCVKAYWAFPLLRNVIEVMSELSNSRVFLKGGNKKTNDFISAWFDRIGFWKLKEQFFREYFRSGNVFIYRFDGGFTPDGLKKMTQVYGSSNDNFQIPLKYTILNPEFMTVGGNVIFQTPTYFKILSKFELNKITNPQTQEEKDFANSLAPEVLKGIKERREPLFKLDQDKLSVIFYKSQPYEPMGIPMAFGVLDDIETKLELKRIDLAVAKTTDRAMLLITAGEKAHEWNKSGLNQNTLIALQDLFNTNSATRTLVADYTVKGEWLLPEINKVLGQEKYKQIDEDIRVGLNAILFDSNEKFANTSLKVQIFIERLKEARQAFLTQFLIPEIKSLCRKIGSKIYPEPVFEEIDLRDQLQYSKFVMSLAQVGLLTPSEVFESLDTGKLPLPDESVEHQKEFKLQREEGLYMPLVGTSPFSTDATNGDSKSPSANSVGRPVGSKAPQTTKKITPIGETTASASTRESYSLTKIRDISLAMSALNNEIESKLRKTLKTKKLSTQNIALAKFVTESISANEELSKWNEYIDEYVTSVKEVREDIASEINLIAAKHGVDTYLATTLYLSKNENA